jgi:hypothetical protein
VIQLFAKKMDRRVKPGDDGCASGGTEPAEKQHRRYFFCTEGHGAPQGAQAPAKSSGETGRPAEGDVRWSAKSAANPKRKTMA